MTKIIEEALGGEYTVTVNPYPSTTAAMKATMDGDGEIGYTADVGMAELYAGEGGFKNYTPAKPKMVHTWYAYPMESFMAVSAKNADKYKCWKDFSGKPVFFTPAGFMNWMNFRRVYKTLGYDFKHVQIDPKTQSDALAGRHDHRCGRLHHGGPLAGAVLEGNRNPHGRRGDQSVPRRGRQAQGRRPRDRDRRSEERLHQERRRPADSGVPILFAYNARPDLPEDVVYKILVAFDKNKDKLAATDAGLRRRWRRTSSACR